MPHPPTINEHMLHKAFSVGGCYSNDCCTFLFHACGMVPIQCMHICFVTCAFDSTTNFSVTVQKHGNDVPVYYNLVTTCVQGCNKVVGYLAYIVCTSTPAYMPLLSYMYMYNGGFHFCIFELQWIEFNTSPVNPLPLLRPFNTSLCNVNWAGLETYQIISNCIPTLA